MRKLLCGVRSRYTGGTVCQRQTSEVGIPTLFSNVCWHLHARVIEIQTSQQLKNNFSHETQQIFVNKFGIWTPSVQVRVRCSDFSKLRVYAVYSNRHPPSLFGKHCEILRWRTLRKMLKRWWARLEKRRVATESGGDETGTKAAVPETKPTTRRRRWLVTNETAATGGVMYTDEGELEFESTSAIFVWRALRNFSMADFEKNVEEIVGMTREAASGDRVWRGRDRRSRDEPGDKTATTAGDERDGCDWWGNVYERRVARI